LIGALFITLFVALFFGIPVGFSIILGTIVAISIDGTISLSIVAQRLITGPVSFSLLALPLFVFAGHLMSFGGVSKLMNLANMLLQGMPGATGSIASVGSAFFGAVSGSGVATTAAVGSIIGPEMIKKGYPKGYSASLIGASGTLGVLIPPSIASVIYASIASTSIGSQLLAGALPGISCMLCLVLLNTIMSFSRGYEKSPKKISYTAKQRLNIFAQAIPPLLMPVIILGGIMSGIATPTEAAVIGTVYAIFLSMVIYRKVNFKKLIEVTLKSVETSAMILLIISAATPFAWLLTIKNVPRNLSAMMFDVITIPFFITATVIVLILILGTFVEGISIIILTTPLLLPIMKDIGYDPVHFGVILLMAVNIGAITPPLAVTLYTACSIVDAKIEEVFPDIFYILLAMILAVIIVTMFPGLSLWLPNLML